MKTYLELMAHVMEHGHVRDDRTGTGTRGVFGHQMRFDLRQGFPAVTTKRLFWRGVVEELLWFLRGSTNAHELQQRRVHIWDEWAAEDGELGPVYGAQWRDWGGWPTRGEGIDQIARVIEQIKTNPTSRRHIVSAWNVEAIEHMALPPCHAMFQFHVSQGRLSCQLYQRSADLFLGVPFNIASYALLTHMVAQVCDLQVADFVHTLGDAHIYSNHEEQVRTQLAREPLGSPTLWLNPDVRTIDGFGVEDIKLEGYTHHPAIRAPISV